MQDLPVNYDYLIDFLRLHLGDLDATSYRYIDSWLRTALVLSVRTLMKWWNFKYLLDTDNNVYRNPNDTTFIFPNPPIIEPEDERPIVLMASIIIKQGSLENSAWSAGTWRDAEIYYSNTEGSKAREASIQRDWDDLSSILKAPQKRLIKAFKNSLPGYKGNMWETPQTDNI